MSPLLDQHNSGVSFAAWQEVCLHCTVWYTFSESSRAGQWMNGFQWQTRRNSIRQLVTSKKYVDCHLTDVTDAYSWLRQR